VRSTLFNSGKGERTRRGARGSLGEVAVKAASPVRPSSPLALLASPLISFPLLSSASSLPTNQINQSANLIFLKIANKRPDQLTVFADRNNKFRASLFLLFLDIRLSFSAI
jgi:hypothetical protein